jgi:hypothetical protein
MTATLPTVLTFDELAAASEQWLDAMTSASGPDRDRVQLLVRDAVAGADYAALMPATELCIQVVVRLEVHHRLHLMVETGFNRFFWHDIVGMAAWERPIA